MGVFARAFRRAQLPARMSQGFNPRPRFSLPSPLPVGIEGLDELLELDLTDKLPPDEVARRLDQEMPDGVDIDGAKLIEPPVRAHVRSVRYRALGELPPGAVERCAAADELPAIRRDDRELNIRPYLKSIDRCDGGCEFEVLVTSSGSARPAEITAALCGGDTELPKHLSLVRTAVDLAAP